MDLSCIVYKGHWLHMAEARGKAKTTFSLACMLNWRKPNYYIIKPEQQTWLSPDRHFLLNTPVVNHHRQHLLPINPSS
jgi:hypothetical protein